MSSVERDTLVSPAVYVMLFKAAQKDIALTKRLQLAVISSGRLNPILAGFLASSFGRTGDMVLCMTMFEQLVASKIELNSHFFTAILSALTKHAGANTARDLKRVLKQLKLCVPAVEMTPELGAAMAKVACCQTQTQTALISRLCSQVHRVLGQHEAASDQFHALASRNVSLSPALYASTLATICSQAPVPKLKLRAVVDRYESERDTIELTSQLTNALIKAYTLLGQFSEAVDVITRAREQNVELSSQVYATALKACADGGLLETGRKLFVEAQTVPDARTDAAQFVRRMYLHLLSKCQELDEAERVLANMAKPGVEDWTILINGYAIARKADDALRLLTTMQSKNVQPNAVTFIAVLLALSHAGRVDEAINLLALMQSHGVQPDIKHHTAVLDAVARAGRLEQAERLLTAMPERDIVSYMTVLGACRTHRNVEWAERLFAAIERLPPTARVVEHLASAHVLMCNIYTDAGLFEASARLHREMQARRLFKEPGATLVEVDGKVHVFRENEHQHPDIAAVLVHWNKIKQLMDAHGYKTDIRWACSHSEKLALAFADLKTAPGLPLRIVKDLRVCGDCHEAMKFLSLVLKREIRCRDANVYHHYYINAVCSCKDVF